MEINFSSWYIKNTQNYFNHEVNEITQLNCWSASVLEQEPNFSSQMIFQNQSKNSGTLERRYQKSPHFSKVQTLPLLVTWNNKVLVHHQSSCSATNVQQNATSPGEINHFKDFRIKVNRGLSWKRNLKCKFIHCSSCEKSNSLKWWLNWASALLQYLIIKPLLRCFIGGITYFLS